MAHFYVATLGIKTLPVLLCACTPRAGRLCTSLLAVAALLSSISILYAVEKLTYSGVLVALGTLLYYVAAARVVFWLFPSERQRRPQRDVVLAVTAVLYVCAPALPLRHYEALPALVLGWNMMLSTYSYASDARLQPAAAKFSEFLFFVIVDPALSYPERSRPVALPWSKTMRRIVQGTVMMAVGQYLLLHWRPVTLEVAHAIRTDGSVPAASAALTLAFIFPIYWLRAGSAHVRIGLMEALGYQPPECFRRPYLARSPADFWRRWNCWIGAWLKRYIFTPLSLWMVRKSVRIGPRQGVIVRNCALACSFVLMGVLHDWLTWMAQGVLFFVYIRVFLFAAVGFLLWEFGASWSTPLRGRLRCPPAITLLLSHAYCAVYVAGMLVLAMSIL